MMKKEMIEEMAQCKNFNGVTCKTCNEKCACARYDLAQQIYERFVVLSKEEYAELKQAKSLLEFREETIKYLEDANIRYAKALELKVNEKERKETAREILNDIHTFIHSETMRKGYELKKLDKRIKELAERYDVEVEE